MWVNLWSVSREILGLNQEPLVSYICTIFMAHWCLVAYSLIAGGVSQLIVSPINTTCHRLQPNEAFGFA